jgi:hypothetical protein
VKSWEQEARGLFGSGLLIRPHQLLEHSRRKRWSGSCPECPEFEKTTRDTFAPMFTGLSRVSRASRVKNRSSKDIPADARLGTGLP